MSTFYPADVGREIVGAGGLGTITAYVDPDTVTVEILQPFPAAAFDTGEWAITGSPSTTCTPSGKDPVGAIITLTLGVAGWRPGDVGSYVRINGGLCKITSLTSDVIANATIESVLTSIVTVPALGWTLEDSMWGGAFGYPRCGTLFEQRHWLAGSPGFPQALWGSVIGEYLDHTVGTLDDEAISYILASGESNPIMHLASARGLIALTTGGEFSIQGGQDRAITPTNLDVKDQSNYGCSQVPPERVGQEIYFTQRAGRKIRAMSPNQYDSGQYVAPDMATLAEHVTESGVVAMAYMPEPEATLYLVRADGQMATLACDRDQDVFAWARQTTQGSYEDVERVPTAEGGNVFVIVSRTIGGVATRYIEMFEPGLHTDCAVTGTSDVGATTWSGLTHLEGRTVRAKGDGVYLGEFVVTGGAITLPRIAYAVEIGLDYITTIKTLTPEFMGPGGSSQGHQLSVSNVVVKLLDSIGCTINLQQVPFRKLGLGVLDQAPEPYTGNKKAGNLGWGDGYSQTLIQQTLPYPFHLLSVITTITANEG